ncbi:MAG TPA: DNA-binding response regulator [Cyanobacteria bacterium UBA8530]|nr:DNA-binding response regulator [Cyanobacteria bacterium UBA8530]
MTITIFLADDHQLLRDGLRVLLGSQSDFQVVAEAADGRTAVRMVLELLPDVVIMDIAMNELNGLEATRQILAASPNSKVLGLSGHSDRHYVVEMLKAGALGYVLKDSAFDELAHAVRCVASGHFFLGSRIRDAVLKDYVHQLTKLETLSDSPLTARERETIQLTAEGKTTKQTADSLGISVKTVETYRQQIMAKLNLHSIAELTKYAIREGFTSLEQ